MKKTIYNLLSNVHCKQALENLKSMEQKLYSPQAKFAIPFTFRGKGHFKSILPMQNPDEMERLFEKVRQIKPKRLVEIGTAKGGALYLWCQAAEEKATIVSVDLPGGEFGGGYPTCRIPFYESFCKGSQKIHLVRADSHSPKTVLEVESLFDHHPIDFLFIDGDHTYEGAKVDFEQYGPLVCPGGIIAFHDILPRPDIPSIQVHKLWEELKARFECEEIIGREGSGRTIGSGVIYVPEGGIS